MSFTAKDVAALREKTGCGMMDCKKALTESAGDVDKAIEYLREKGLAAAAKKADRIASEGVVAALSENGRAVLIEVNSETDFVSKNEEFQKFVAGCAKAVLDSDADTVEQLLTASFGGAGTVEEALREKILTIGENLKIRRFVKYSGVTESYIHGGGRIGVLCAFDTDCADKEGFAEYAKNVCMQIAAVTPLYVRKEEIPAEVLAKEKEVLMAQAINEGKPANIAEKMVQGRISKYFKEACLLDQPYVRDDSLSVQQYTEQTAQALDGHISVVKFDRFEKGEGLEKRVDDFACEINKLTGK
ncbi:MAG: elongation factor Ts [Clostridiales bacterium]|nr:elongation factor Ts [Clostridiales bacterium]